MEISIRQERAGDREAVYAVHTAAFGRKSEATLVDLLRNDQAFIPALSIVAHLGDQLVGHVLITEIEIVSEDGKVTPSLALAPIAVVPEFQQQGIGSRLIKVALDKARSLGYSSVIVLGHAAYYPKFGFVPAGKWQIKAPFEVADEVFMALELQPGGLAGISGTVRYSKPFENV